MKTQWAVGPKTGWSAGSDAENATTLFFITPDGRYQQDKDKLYWLETGMIYNHQNKHYRRKAR